jgi:hypothetical protein
MPLPKSKKEADFQLRHKKLEIVADAVHLFIPWASLVAIFVLAYLTVDKLAGKTTMAQLGMNFVGSIRIPDAVAFLFGGAGGGLAFRERNLRHKKTAEMAAHTQRLEAIIDSRRTTSGLTPHGTTRPEDRL